MKHTDAREVLQRGFTLLEIMVALAIFSVCALVLVQQSGRSAQQSTYLQTRTLAIWVAENQLHELRSELKWPSAGKKSKRVEMAGKQWDSAIEITNTANPHLRKVVIGVSEYRPGVKTQVFSLVSYMGEH